MADMIVGENLLFGEEYTEITRAHKQFLFYMASARVRGVELVRLLYGEKLSEEMKNKLTRTFKRVLNGMKKREDISFFLAGKELSSESTTARYLMEKCPFLADELKSGEIAAFYIYL